MGSSSAAGACSLGGCWRTAACQLSCCPATCCQLRVAALCALQEYIVECHALREKVEAALKAAGVTATPPTPANLPWFDLLPHPAA